MQSSSSMCFLNLKPMVHVDPNPQNVPATTEHCKIAQAQNLANQVY